MNNFLPIISALATAVWSVWTWSQEQQKERQVKRDREAALYVNALLAATEELQSKLYRILAEDELAEYKKEYREQSEPGSAPAVEFLHCLGQYLGWAHRTFRYGPYTNDAQLITLIRRINHTFESSGVFPGQAFRLTLDERVSLGTALVRRVGESDPTHPEFETIPFYQFLDEFTNEANRHAALYQSNAIRRVLAAIDGADSAQALEGHERLAVLQNLLVDLLSYLESKEGFRVALGERKRVPVPGHCVWELAEEANVEPPAAKVGDGSGAGATIVHRSPGRLRLRVPRVKDDESYAGHLQTVLGGVEKVSGVRITASAASVVVYSAAEVPAAALAERVLAAIRRCG